MREGRAVGEDVLPLRAIVGMVPPGADAVKPGANALHSLVAARSGEEWHAAEIERVRAAGETVG